MTLVWFNRQMPPPSPSDQDEAGDTESGVETSSIEWCAVCGTAVDTTEWHQARHVTTEHEFQIYVFCSDACLDIWETD